MIDIFLNYFIPTLAIVSAIGVIPVTILIYRRLMDTIDLMAVHFKDYMTDRKINKLLSGRWQLSNVETCPNPSYLKFTYATYSGGKKELTVSHDIYEAEKLKNG